MEMGLEGAVFVLGSGRSCACTLHTGSFLVPRVQKLSEKTQNKIKQNKTPTGKEVEKQATGPH
jgi:hypothetical protein